jgi:hypothetical protein
VYAITFVNPFAASIQVDIRAGSSSCDRNASCFNGQLGPGVSWTLNTGENVVCYRRTSNPGMPGSGLGEWSTFSPDDINTPATIQL